MQHEESLDFFGEFEQHLYEENFRPILITLVCGRAFKVTGAGQCTVYRTFYSLTPEDGPRVLFPFSQVSCVEILSDD